MTKLNDQFVHSRVPASIGNTYDDLSCVSPPYSFSFRCVAQFEVLECISVVKSNAIDSDDLDPLFLKVLTPRLLPFYAHLFNTVLTKSTFPDGWKSDKILRIPKTNNEFRPIAFLPVLSKVMENVIAIQINSSKV